MINFLDLTIVKWPLSGHFEFCDIYLTQEMQDGWIMNIKQNVMSHTRITHDKLHTEKSGIKKRKNPVGHLIFFFIILEILHDS